MNNAFIDAIDETHSEAIKIYEKNKNRKTFFHRYYYPYHYLDISLSPLIKGGDAIDSSAYRVSNHHRINYMVGGSSEGLYLNRKLNWNREFLDNQFDDHYIGYCIHELLETCVWSFQDLLNIEEIWTRIVGTYNGIEYYTNIIKV